MLCKGLVSVLGRGGVIFARRAGGAASGAGPGAAVSQSAVYVPRRTWAQVGIIATPPRIYVSFLEKVLHGLFMYVVWLSPVMFFLTQVKVWRRKYIET